MKDVNSRILEDVEREGIGFVHLQFVDIHGSVKSRVAPADALPVILKEGMPFDGSSIAGFVNIEESDLVARPDLSTFTVLPWTNGSRKSGRFICDVFNPDGTPFQGDPRYLLKVALQEADEMGFHVNAGPEVEFCLFKSNGTEPLDRGAYMDYLPFDEAEDLKEELIVQIKKMGIESEIAHHETAPGQNEIVFRYVEALKAADNVVTFKLAARMLAISRGWIATFMPKPIFGAGANGQHIHMSLIDKETGGSVFFDHDSPDGFSDRCKHFIGGLLSHAKAMSAIAACTVNSYKRLVPGLEAPIYITWGRGNRSVLVRVPNYYPKEEKSTRVEYRGPDGSCNPYLAMAAMIKAGVDGIRAKSDPGEPIQENVYRFTPRDLKKHKIQNLPSSLGEALEELRKDPIVQSALGSHTFPIFYKIKMKEWEEYLEMISREGDPGTRISQWEMARYFESS
jgi:glutamine synthetase